MTKMELNPAKARLIFGFFENYLKLNEHEEEELMEQIKHIDEMDEILKLPISWEEKGIEKGKEEEKRKIASEMLKEGLPIEVIVKVTHLDKEEIEVLKKK